MRRDGGIYQCRPLEADSLPDVKGEMQLTVHCEEPSLKRSRASLTSYTANMFTRQLSAFQNWATGVAPSASYLLMALFLCVQTWTLPSWCPKNLSSCSEEKT